MSQQEMDNLSVQWQQRVAGAAQQAQQAGKLSATMARMIEIMLQPQLPWRSLLARYMVSTARNDYDYSHHALPPFRAYAARATRRPPPPNAITEPRDTSLAPSASRRARARDISSTGCHPDWRGRSRPRRRPATRRRESAARACAQHRDAETHARLSFLE